MSWSSTRTLNIKDRIGDSLTAAGEHAKALDAYRAAMLIAEQLTKLDPDNREWQHDISVSHGRIGDSLKAAGERAKALEAYRAAMAIAEQLTKLDPDNSEWQDDLSVSHGRIGDGLKAAGERAEAVEAYRAAMAIDEQLIKLDPDNSEWQRNRLAFQMRLAEFSESGVTWADTAAAAAIEARGLLPLGIRSRLT